MLGKRNNSAQLEFFRVPIKDKLDSDNILMKIAAEIEWEKLDRELSVYYSPDKGRPGIPIRMIAGMIILKKLLKLNNDKLLDFWLKDPACQFFCGEVYPQSEPPFAISELFRFRRRIGEAGMKKIDRQFLKITNRDLQKIDQYKISRESVNKNYSLFTSIKRKLAGIIKRF